MTHYLGLRTYGHETQLLCDRHA